MAAEQVRIGLAELVDASDLYKLQTQYFPVGKIGGKPAWLGSSSCAERGRLEV